MMPAGQRKTRKLNKESTIWYIYLRYVYDIRGRAGEGSALLMLQLTRQRRWSVFKDNNDGDADVDACSTNEAEGRSRSPSDRCAVVVDSIRRSSARDNFTNS